MVIGAKGFPDVAGGIEKHCAELYSRLSLQNELCIEVCAIKRYSTQQSDQFSRIKYRYFSTFQRKGVEKIIYALQAVLYASYKRPDIVHFQGLNSVLFLPIIKLFGIKTVVTIHSRDYLYPKWGKIAKLFLRASERISFHADALITVSELDYNNNKRKTKNLHLIKNGVTQRDCNIKNEQYYLDKYCLSEKSYLFSVGRFTEEKDLVTMINGYLFSKLKVKLVIAGDGDTEYSSKVKKLAASKNIILTGYIFGDELQSLFSNAKIFLLSSTHEVAAPITVLEAMSYNLSILLSDIDVNQILPLENSSYFSAGDYKDFSKSLLWLFNNEHDNYNNVSYLEENHNWDSIANETHALYKTIIAYRNEFNTPKPLTTF